VPVAWLCGVDTVGEAMQDEAIRHYVQQTIDEEIIPALDLPADELGSLPMP
jgi:tagaturonate reductase